MAKEFAKAEGKRVVIVNAQQKVIRKLYKDALKEIEKDVKLLQSKTNVSSIVRRQYLRDLQREIKKNLDEIDRKTIDVVQTNMALISEKIVEVNSALLKEMGFSQELYATAYLHVPDQVVKEIASGALYKGRWALSKAIWQDNALKNKELEIIVAKGVALNRNTYEIAKDLEKYVNPMAKKDWDWSKVYPGVRRKIDYNAQRLARTMVSHAYEESFVRTTQKNPFVEAYKWLPSYGDRMCALCESRGSDDQYGLGPGIFPKDELPLDHPNGMCTFEAVIPKSYDQIADVLADWVLGRGSRKMNRELDAFVKDLQS